jgi:NAD(P)H-quinone oxidoreductase subunit 5
VHSPLSEFDILIRIAIVLLFALVGLMQRILPDRDGERWLALYTHISNGFYINTIANRLAIRFWPSPAPRSSVPSYIPSSEGER